MRRSRNQKSCGQSRARCGSTILKAYISLVLCKSVCQSRPIIRRQINSLTLLTDYFYSMHYKQKPAYRVLQTSYQLSHAARAVLSLSDITLSEFDLWWKRLWWFRHPSLFACLLFFLQKSFIFESLQIGSKTKFCNKRFFFLSLIFSPFFIQYVWDAISFTQRRLL